MNVLNDYVCPYCFCNIEDCTCSSKPQELIQIDRNMQEIIRILNKKGYKTMYCCESHKPTENMYIKFKYDYGFGHELPMPDGFDNIYNGVSFMYVPKTTSKEFAQQKKEHLDSLMDWCEELPTAKFKCTHWTDMYMV